MLGVDGSSLSFFTCGIKQLLYVGLTAELRAGYWLRAVLPHWSTRIFMPAESTLLCKQLFVQDLQAKDVVRTSFLVRSKELMVSRKGDPYLALILADRTGEIETRIWDSADRVAATFQEGDVVVVAGKAHLFQNRLQLVVDQLAPIPPAEVNLEDYLPTASADLEKSYAELIAIFERVTNPWIRQLGLLLLNDPEI